MPEIPLPIQEIFQRLVTWPTLVKGDIPQPIPPSEEIPAACDGRYWDPVSLTRCITAVCQGMGQHGVTRQETIKVVRNIAEVLAEVVRQFAYTDINNLTALANHGKTARWLQWHAARFAIENIPGLCGGPPPQPVMDASPVPVESEARVRKMVQEGCDRSRSVLPLLAGATLAFGLRLIQRIAVPSTAMLEFMLHPDSHGMREETPQYL